MADGLSFKIIFITAIAVLALFLISVQGAPANLQTPDANSSDSDTSQESQNDEEYDIIDQSQNGTENYRINIKDVAVIWAPANVLLAATALLDAQLFGEEFLGGEDFADLEKPQAQEPIQITLGSVENKPTPQNSSSVESPAPINPTSKPAHLRSKFHFPSVVGPFLRRKHDN